MTQDFVSSRRDLYDLVWSHPLLFLSKKYDMSDVGLRKICERMMKVTAHVCAKVVRQFLKNCHQYKSSSYQKCKYVRIFIMEQKLFILKRLYVD